MKVKVGKISFENGVFCANVSIVNDKGNLISASQVMTQEYWDVLKEPYPIIKCYDLKRQLYFQVSASSPEDFVESVKMIYNLTHMLRLGDYDMQQALTELHRQIKIILGDDYYKEA